MGKVSAEALLRRISYHAVARYAQRILGVPELRGPFADNAACAAAHCAMVGETIESVRRMILTPAVAAGLIAGAYSVRSPHFIAIMQPSSDGHGIGVRTIYDRYAHLHHGRVIHTTRAEGKREAQKQQRRNRKRRPAQEWA